MQNIPKNTSLPVTHIGLNDFVIVGYTNLPNKNLFNEIDDETKEVPYPELEKSIKDNLDSIPFKQIEQSIINNINSLPTTLNCDDDECDTPIYVETKEEIPPVIEPLLPDECYNNLKEVTFIKCINPPPMIQLVELDMQSISINPTN